MRCFSSPGALRIKGAVIVSRRWGCPIRRSWDQCLLAAPPRLSQLCHVLHRHAAPRHPPSAHTVFPEGRPDVESYLDRLFWRSAVRNDHAPCQHTLHLVRYNRIAVRRAHARTRADHVQSLGRVPSPLNRDDDHMTAASSVLGVGGSLRSTFPRKEVIQPHLPVRLPCYDFVPVAAPALGRCLLAVGPRTSGLDNSHDVTGGVYKARVRIHRAMADTRLLATPPSWGRVAAPNLH